MTARIPARGAEGGPVNTGNTVSLKMLNARGAASQ